MRILLAPCEHEYALERFHYLRSYDVVHSISGDAASLLVLCMVRMLYTPLSLSFSALYSAKNASCTALMHTYTVRNLATWVFRVYCRGIQTHHD